jgi:hypothetical protein
MELINECRIMFGVKLHTSELVAERTKKYIRTVLASDDSLAKQLADSE